MEQQSMGVHGYMRIFGEVGKKQKTKNQDPALGSLIESMRRSGCKSGL